VNPSGLSRRLRVAAVVAVALVPAIFGGGSRPAPDAPRRHDKPRAPIDAALRIEPLGDGRVRLVLSARSRADLTDATALIRVDAAAVREGTPRWQGALARGRALDLSVVVDAGSGEPRTFEAGVVGTLAGGARVAAPAQAEYAPLGGRPARPDKGTLRANRLGQRIIEYPGVTRP
jgi:hypothetical protein